MTRWLKLVGSSLGAAVLLAALLSVAHADPPVDVVPEGSSLAVHFGQEQAAGEVGPENESVTQAGPRPRIIYRIVCERGGTAVCEVDRTCEGTGTRYAVLLLYPDGSTRMQGFICRGGRDDSLAAPPEVTNAMVLRALRRVGVPEPVLVVQPPGGRTLVNFETIFSTEAEPFTASVRLVGRDVDLRVRPVGFVWTHGDGTSQRSDSPGRRYARGVALSEYLTHVYTDAGVTVRPRVSVEYGASFRVDGGPWREVIGTVTVPGEPVDLRIVEAQPQLVSAG